MDAPAAYAVVPRLIIGTFPFVLILDSSDVPNPQSKHAEWRNLRPCHVEPCGLPCAIPRTVSNLLDLNQHVTFEKGPIMYKTK